MRVPKGIQRFAKEKGKNNNLEKKKEIYRKIFERLMKAWEKIRILLLEPKYI